MTLEPLFGSTALYRADVSWNTSSELSGYEPCDREYIIGTQWRARVPRAAHAPKAHRRFNHSTRGLGVIQKRRRRSEQYGHRQVGMFIEHSGFPEHAHAFVRMSITGCCVCVRESEIERGREGERERERKREEREIEGFTQDSRNTLAPSCA